MTTQAQTENFHGPLGMQDKDGIDQIIRETCEHAGMQEAYGDITWEFSGRLKTTLGQACLEAFKVELCFALWGRASYAQRRDVIIHETVHLLATRKYKEDVGHNFLWKRMMVQCHGDPNRCHEVSTKGIKRKQKRYNVACRCTKHDVSQNKLTRMQNGNDRICNRCGWKLNPTTAVLIDWWLYEDES